MELARRGVPVHLSTTDPAAHIAETLAAALRDRLDSFVHTLSHELKNPLGARRCPRPS